MDRGVKMPAGPDERRSLTDLRSDDVREVGLATAAAFMIPARVSCRWPLVQSSDISEGGRYLGSRVREGLVAGPPSG